MPYLIDGHNLIPHIRGLSLDQIDDEMALIDMLEHYFQRIRKKAIIYFDHAQVGSEQDIKRAFLKVHFVRPPAIADDAILRHLKKLRGDAKNWVVVSSDQYVQRGAAKMGAQVLSSAEFAGLLDQPPKNSNHPGPFKENPDDDIDQWLRAFGQHS